MDFRVTRQLAIAEAHEKCANPWCRVRATDVHHIFHRHEGGTTADLHQWEDELTIQLEPILS